MSERQLVFAYGLLRMGFWNTFLLGQSKCLGKGRTANPYGLFVTWVPYTTRRVHRTPIIGEVYEVDLPTLRNLDRLKGHPEWYTRHQEGIVMDNGETLSAWCYVIDEPQGGQMLTDGDFEDHFVRSAAYKDVALR